MKKYEIMYILNASLDEAARKETIDTLHAIVTNGNGSIVKVDEMGLREFAYKIEDMTKGYYVVTTVEADADVVAEFDRICRINSNVIRTMIVKLED